MYENQSRKALLPTMNVAPSLLRLEAQSNTTALVLSSQKDVNSKIPRSAKEAADFTHASKTTNGNTLI